MYFILSKTISFLLKPFVWMVILFILTLVLKKYKLKKICFLSVFVLLFFFGNGLIANLAMTWWEHPVTPISKLKGNYKYGVVLSGVTDSKREPRDRVYFHKGAGRVTHAYRLYKMGKIDKILISGGSGRLLGQDVMDADLIVMYYDLVGVPREDILLENQSRNTYENAAFSADLIKADNPEAKVVLITSAFHMKRALACFESQDLTVTPFSTDFHSSVIEFDLIGWLVPGAGAFSAWETILKEIFGIATYWVMGYI